jgi:glyoxylase-like metal-dependent hydrolase (beta-lactamase superfamily II)
MRLDPGLPLYRLTVPTPFPVGPVNLYLITEPETVLIDTGPDVPGWLPRLEALFAECGVQLGDLRKMVLTHSHQDHCGTAPELAARTGAEIFASEVEGRHFRHDAELDVFYARLIQESGTPPPLIAKMQAMHRQIRSTGQAIAAFHPIAEVAPLACGPARFQVLPTPGHTIGSASLWDPERRILLAADTVIQDITPNPFTAPDPAQPDRRFRSLGVYLETLARIAALDPAVIYGGHGPPITDFAAYHAWALDLHRQRQDAILRCLANGARSVHDVASCLFPEAVPHGAFLALTEVFSHLDLLEEEGRVRHESREGVAIYSTTR